MHLNKMSRKLLDEGDIIELKEGMVRATIPYHCLNKPGEFGRGVFDKFMHTSVSLSKCEWLQGKYVVYKTTLDPGGESSHDLHPIPGPSVWHVFCERMDESKTRVDFFQTGEEDAMQYDIEPIGRAELKYQEKFRKESK